MHHYLLIYDYVDDYLKRRASLRADHLQRAWAAVDRGELILGGAFEPPQQTGLLLFRAKTEVTAEDFARNDPYVLNGIVKAWRVVEWLTVVGEHAANPAGR